MALFVYAVVIAIGLALLYNSLRIYLILKTISTALEEQVIVSVSKDVTAKVHIE